MKNKKGDGPDFPVQEPYSLFKLRQLVAALSIPEKNTFKRYIRSYSDNNKEASYIRLFDCVNDCLIEGERLLRKGGELVVPDIKAETFYQKFKLRYAKRGFGKAAALGSKANYLYERILESQRNLNTDKLKRRELYGRMLDIQMLYNKGLKEECLSMVYYAKKLADQLEALPQLLELMQTERQLLGMSRHDDLDKKLRDIDTAEQKCLKQLKLTTSFNDLRMEATLFQTKKGKLEESSVLRSKINRFLQDSLESQSFDTFDLNFHYHSIRANLVLLDMNQPSPFLAFLDHNEQVTVVTHLKTMVDLYKKYPERKKEDFPRYIGHLSNYLLSAYVFSREETRLEDYRADLDKIKTSSPFFIQLVVFITLVEYIKGRHFKEAQDFIFDKKVWELVGSLGNQIPPTRLQTVRVLAGTVFFVRGNFAEADRWFSANLDTEARLVHAESMIASKLYQLLARFELGLTTKISQQEELLKSLTRRLGTPLLAGSFEAILLASLKEILKVGNKSDKLKSTCEKHLAALKEKIRIKEENSHYNLFIGWIESKCSGTSLRFAVDPYL